AGSLCHRQNIFVFPGQILPGVGLVHIATPELIRQPQVNPDLGLTRRHTRVFNLTLDVDVPAPTSILGKAACLGYACDGARGPKAIAALEVREAVSVELEKAQLEGHPAERALATAPFEAAFVTGLPLGDILAADFGDGIAVQPQLTTRSSREVDQINSAQ